MKKNKLQRTSVQLPTGYIAEIRRLAQHRGESASDIIRQAIREYLVTEMVDTGRWNNEDR